jgi:hypothetical protein
MSDKKEDRGYFIKPPDELEKCKEFVDYVFLIGEIRPFEYILKCVRCKKEYNLSSCSNCNWHSYAGGKNKDGETGIFCWKCNLGFTSWKCDCGAINPIAPSSIIKSSSGGCFIVTATYGDLFSPEVIFFSEFRDKILNKSIIGKSLIKIYYNLSPFLASIISKLSVIRFITKSILIRPLFFIFKKIYRF